MQDTELKEDILTFSNKIYNLDKITTDVFKEAKKHAYNLVQEKKHTIIPEKLKDLENEIKFDLFAKIYDREEDLLHYDSSRRRRSGYSSISWYLKFFELLDTWEETQSWDVMEEELRKINDSWLPPYVIAGFMIKYAEIGVEYLENICFSFVKNDEQFNKLYIEAKDRKLKLAKEARKNKEDKKSSEESYDIC